MKIILWILVVTAVLAVCIKKSSDLKKGKFCGCGCDNCPAKCKSRKKLKD